MLRPISSLIALAITVVPALAGAPLKGVDVKLGRNPGGMVAARTTGGDGSFDFGVLPKGRYVITFGGAAGGPAVVNLKGSAEGAFTRPWPSPRAARWRGRRAARSNSPPTAATPCTAM